VRIGHRGLAALAVLAARALVAPQSSHARIVNSDASTPAKGGCPDDYEPAGILITKGGAAYLVSEDEEGNVIYLPLT
jgi:hypothetical protein